MSIKRLLSISISFLVVLMGALGLLTWWGMQATLTGLSELSGKSMVAANELQNLSLDYQQMRRYEKEYFIFLGDLERRTKYGKDWQDANARIVKRSQELIKNSENRFSAQELVQISSWQQGVDNYAKGFQSLQARIETGSITDGVTANNENIKNVDFVRPLNREAPELANNRVSSAQAAVNELTAQTTRLFWILAAMVVVIIAVLFYLLIRLPRSISGPIQVFAQTAERLTKGEYNVGIQKTDIVEFKPLAESLERLANAMRYMMERIRR